MKKNLAGLFVAAAMVVSLCACGSGGSGSTTADKTSEAAAGAATEAAEMCIRDRYHTVCSRALDFEG